MPSKIVYSTKTKNMKMKTSLNTAAMNNEVCDDNVTLCLLDKLTEKFLNKTHRYICKELACETELDQIIKDSVRSQMQIVQYNIQMRNLLIPALIRAQKNDNNILTNKYEEMLKTIGRSTAIVNDTQRMINETKTAFVGQTDAQIAEKVRAYLVDLALDDKLPRETILAIQAAVMR